MNTKQQHITFNVPNHLHQIIMEQKAEKITTSSHYRMLIEKALETFVFEIAQFLKIKNGETNSKTISSIISNDYFWNIKLIRDFAKSRDKKDHIAIQSVIVTILKQYLYYDDSISLQPETESTEIGKGKGIQMNKMNEAWKNRKYLLLTEVGKIVNRNHDTVRVHICKGKLPAIKIGNTWHVRPIDVINTYNL